MILYRYLGSHAYESLNEARLKTARVSDLNDPFELLYKSNRELTTTEAASMINNRLKDSAFHQTLKTKFPNDNPAQLQSRLTQPHVIAALVGKQPEIVEHGLDCILSNADSTLRLLCFSSEETGCEDEILLWSHYASKHRGHRIGFKIPTSPTNVYRIDSVTYSPDRVSADYNGDPADSKFLAAMFKSIGTKNVVWRYENEYRLTTTPERCIPAPINEKLEHFLSIDPKWVVRIDCGIRSDSKDDEKIVTLVKSRYPHVSVYKATFHPYDYSIVYAPLHTA